MEKCVQDNIVEIRNGGLSKISIILFSYHYIFIVFTEPSPQNQNVRFIFFFFRVDTTDW